MTDEEESYRRLRDLVHVTLITCCVFVIVLLISAMWARLTVGYDFGDVGVAGRDGDGPGVSSRAVP